MSSDVALFHRWRHSTGAAALQTVRVVDIKLGAAASKRAVTRGTQRAAAVLRALAIKDLDPPTPPQQGQTIM
jgi:hypothetical protein